MVARQRGRRRMEGREWRLWGEERGALGFPPLLSGRLPLPPLGMLWAESPQPRLSEILRKPPPIIC